MRQPTWYNLGMQYTPDIRRLWLRKLLKVHANLLLLFFGVYFVFVFFDPGLLSYDLRQKFRALADGTISITAVVLEPPAQPVVTASADCSETTNVLSVYLDWPDDSNSYTYDLYRDGLPLVTGLANSLYQDTNVSVATVYQYEVTARGPMGPGFATSLPISVTTPNLCGMTEQTPTVTIVSFVGKNVDSYNGILETSNRLPLFSGTTNIVNATILISIGTDFITQFSGSSTGYWEWWPPHRVSPGSHDFTVTAIDPNDNLRQATASLSFEIIGSSDTGERDSKKKSSESPAITLPIVPVGIPLDFALTADEEILQGELLHTRIVIGTLKEKYNHVTVPIRYSVIDDSGSVIFSKTRETLLVAGSIINEPFPIPLYMLSGKYHIQAEIFLDTLDISREASFSVRELPLIRLSSGGAISYADIIRQLGWMIFLLSLLLFLYFFMFIREFALYLRGDGEITEYDLNRAGYFRK